LSGALASFMAVTSGSQSAPPISQQPAPQASTQPSLTNTEPAPRANPGRQTHGDLLPDLMISSYDWKPVPPNRKEPMDVRVIVVNKGNKDSGPFTVQWWPGENYSRPACTWRIENLQIKESRALHCIGYIYPSWHEQVKMAVSVDSYHEVTEFSEENNKLYRETQVRK